MFYEWVSAGAIFGIEAFFAILAFGLCLIALLGLLGIMAGIVKALTGDKDEGRRY